MARKSAQVETRMLSEYLLAAYPQYTSIRAVPLGKVDEKLLQDVGYKKALGFSRPYRPEADAVVILPGALLLIETKVWNVINGLAKLPLYKALVPFTPELQQYKDLPVVMELVVAHTNSNLEIMAKEHGVAVKLFNPAWLQEVVDGLNKYWTADYRQQRAQVIAMRQTLGLE